MPGRRPLAEHLALPYPYLALVDPDDGGYVGIFPNLPSCITQAEDFAEPAADAKALWIEGECEDGNDIPLPS